MCAAGHSTKNKRQVRLKPEKHAVIESNKMKVSGQRFAFEQFSYLHVNFKKCFVMFPY